MSRCVVLAVVLFAPFADAQGSATSPRGGLRFEGLHASTEFGAYGDARTQVMDGVHVGSSFRITQLAWRLDHVVHGASTAMGRTWKRALLALSESSNFAGMSRAFSANITAPVSVVFDGPMDWASHTGRPATRPGPWGGPQGRLRMPLRWPFQYTGRHPLLMDFAFQGGVLANNATWSTGQKHAYHLDAEHYDLVKKASGLEYLPPVTPKCNDSAFTVTNGAYTYAMAEAHGPKSPKPLWRNQLVFWHCSRYTAPNATVIHGVGLNGSRAGMEVGAACNRLYLEFSGYWEIVKLNTSSVQTFADSGVIGALLPWTPLAADVPVYAQGAWADSRTGRFSLTSAVRLTLPTAMPPTTIPPRKVLVGWPATATSGAASPNVDGRQAPFVQFTH